MASEPARIHAARFIRVPCSNSAIETVDIIVPVYKGFHETKTCLESVLKAINQRPSELIVINDQSPDPELTSWLRATFKNALLENDTNQGFIATVNRGMSLHPDRDVVLLNSDTTVANGWLDRMVTAAYREHRIGTVTPFSNNGTICSYPEFLKNNALPPNTTAEELDRRAAEVNRGRSVDLPTAVGFCMLIRRDCLNEIGLFDVETFGKGYGEENDFSLRAAARGWRNILACDVFVYHAGSVSFPEGSSHQGLAALTKRYPHYYTLIDEHIRQDPARPCRLALNRF